MTFTRTLISSFIIFLLAAASLFSQSFFSDTTFNLTGQVDTTLTFSVDYKSKPGFLQLETGENENLAKNKFAYVVYEGSLPADTGRRNAMRLIDGITSSPSFIEFPPLNLGGEAGSYLVIDLQALRTIKRIKMYALGGNANIRARAFTIYAGVDTVGMDKVFQNNDNQVANPVSNFNPIVARFVKITIDVIAQNNSTVMSEIEVFGEGFLPEGAYVSSVKNIGRDVNFSTFEFSGTKPTGTEIYFSFRSGATLAVDSLWSPWSSETTLNNALFEVFEARRYLQYRIRLTTSNLTSPLVDEIKIKYDTLLLAASTDAAISPHESQILKETEFTLSYKLTFGASDRGVDTLYILTSTPATLRSVSINSAPASVSTSVSANQITIIFSSTINTNAVVDVKFLATPFKGINPFVSFVSSKQVAYNPQRVDSKITSNVEGWSIVTTGVPDRLIIRAKAVPNPFTPNGDGINDQTKIEFFLGNIAEPIDLLGSQQRQIQINIFDLTGRLVRELYSENSRAFAYISDNAIAWDGRDDNGLIVRPGLYIFQIKVDSDNGGEFVSKTVVVSY